MLAFSRGCVCAIASREAILLTQETGKSRRAAHRAAERQEGQELYAEEDCAQENCRKHDYEQQRHGRAKKRASPPPLAMAEIEDVCV